MTWHLLPVYFTNSLAEPPEINEFSQGINVFLANPRSVGSDPGLGGTIFDFSSTYDVSQTWSVPSAIDAFDIINACDETSVSHKVESMHMYQESLDVDVRIDDSVGFPSFLGARFSASFDFQQSYDLIVNESFKFMLTRGLCEYYVTQLKDVVVTKFNFTEEFSDFVTAISKDPWNLKLVLDFLRDYGTHYIYKGTSGSRFSKQDIFNEFSWRSALAVSETIEASAEASFLFFETGGFGMEQGDISIAKKYDSTWDSTAESGRGCPFPSGNNGSSLYMWLQCTQESNMATIIQYDIRPIYSLITKLNFPLIDNHDEIQATINQSYWPLCLSTKGCGVTKSFFPKSCQELKDSGETKDGSYTLYYLGDQSTPMEIYCYGMEHYQDITYNFIMLPEVSVSCTEGCQYTNLYVTHYGVPIDSITLRLLKDVTTFSKWEGMWLDFGNVRASDDCGSPNVYSLQGTGFSFNLTVDTSYKNSPTSTDVLDKNHQVVSLTGNCCDDNRGLTNLVYGIYPVVGK